MTKVEMEGALQQIVGELTEIVLATYRKLGAPAALKVLAGSRREIERVHAVEQDQTAYEGSLALLDSLETIIKDAAAQGLTEVVLIAGDRHGSARY